MRTIVVTGAKLFLICAVAAVTLGAINAVTEPVIIQRKILELKQALEELTPDARTGEAIPVSGNATVKQAYPVLSSGAVSGYVLQLTGQGYGGDMKILARFASDGTIRAAKLMDNLETPGLGKKAENPRYMDKFIGTGGPDKPVPVRKDMLDRAQADAVTGATITFLGVSKALAEGAQFVREGNIQ